MHGLCGLSRAPPDAYWRNTLALGYVKGRQGSVEDDVGIPWTGIFRRIVFGNRLEQWFQEPLLPADGSHQNIICYGWTLQIPGGSVLAVAPNVVFEGG